jgi:transposase InsO family protein
MDAYENARTTPHSRMLIVALLAAGWKVAAVAVALGAIPRTVRNWRDRFAAEGEAGPARPLLPPASTASAKASPATASASRRRGHGEGLGWEYLHVAIDDASRLAYTALMPDEKAESAVRFLEDALDWFGAHGLGVECVMTDNGSAFKSKLFAAALQSRGLKHKRTRSYTPRTNGKAERFIQTSLWEWAYAMPFHSSAERARAMPAWLCHYNSLRPHSALGGKPPISRLARDSLLGNDS